MQEFELARDEGCIGRLASPATDVDDVKSVVDESFDGNELREHKVRAVSGGVYGYPRRGSRAGLRSGRVRGECVKAEMDILKETRLQY